MGHTDIPVNTVFTIFFGVSSHVLTRQTSGLPEFHVVVVKDVS
jgi:hypothetical protein